MLPAWSGGVREIVCVMQTVELGATDLTPTAATAEAAEQAGFSQPAVEILSTGEKTSYRIAGSGQNVALRLEKPGSATTFKQALIQSVTVDGREVAGAQAPVAEPGDAILYVASRVKGAKEMQVTVEWSFDVDKLDIWTWTTYTETYSNTITYTFDCTAWN